ncbi:MAG: SMC-Scp complex subunit ScpB [Propionibacteriaceae bacterium]|jgi:segregation and condensation protein B|nr:SMC-Scp complex subunit ScpB [Propionibacteriaceae bacterium]
MTDARDTYPDEALLDDGPSRLIEPELEALLILATEPMSDMELASTIDAPVEDVHAALSRLANFYDRTGRGFELRRVGEGWRYYTRPEHADMIARSVLEGQQGKLSQAGLETLAVIAYLQPIARSRISAVRGVNVDSVVRTLLTRNLIVEVDHDQDSGASLLGTTPYFLERMGLTSLEELPPLAPHLPDATALDEELRHVVADPVADIELGEDGETMAERTQTTAHDGQDLAQSEKGVTHE